MQQYGITVVRLGLAGVLLWFGLQQLLHTADWIGYIPPEALSLSGLTPETLVKMNGGFEVICSLLLAVGTFTRIVAFVMGVHLAAIALSLGHTAVAVRDWGLAAAFFGLVLTGAGALGLDKDSHTT